MADRLTQLQDALDELSTQFFASVRYITTHHPRPPPVGRSSTTTTTTTPGGPDGSPAGNIPETDSLEMFASAQRELARDLILKEQQIEYLISVLPGIGTGEKEQEDRIRRLNDELKQAQEEKKVVAQEREQTLEKLDTTISRVWGKGPPK